MLWTAERIYSPAGWLQHHVLETDEQGQVMALRPRQAADRPQLIEGVLSPGLVNAHCHLELSALKGRVPEGTGMTGFITRLFEQRGDITPEQAHQAVTEALDAAWSSGTVAIGDICNGPISLAAKQADHRVWTHSFIELLGLDPERADPIYQAGLALLDQFQEVSASITAHAPYSMSLPLLRKIGQGTAARRSIHLLESQVERSLFEEAKGPFLRFFERFKLPYTGFKAKGALEHVSQAFPAANPILWVHLTEATPGELEQLSRQFPNSHFCLCPRSNYYIHRRYPQLERFLPYSDRICLGTDSLASNHDLDMVSEMRILQERMPTLALHQLLFWASTAGARALGRADQLGQFAAGTSPGLVQLAPLGPGGMLLPETRARQIIATPHS